MDVEARRNFWHAMVGFTDRGRTILFSTHYIEEADVGADRIVLMARGRVVADGTPSAIKDSVGLRVIRFSIPDGDDRGLRGTARGRLRHRARRPRRVALPRLPTQRCARCSPLDRTPTTSKSPAIALEDAFITITDGIAA